MKNTSILLALALGLTAFNTFAQDETFSTNRQDAPAPRHGIARFEREQNGDRDIQKGRGEQEKRFEQRGGREGGNLEAVRPREGRDRMDRMDRPESKVRGPGVDAERAGRDFIPRHEGRRPEFGPKHARADRMAPDWSFCPFCGHGLKPGKDQGKPAREIRPEGPAHANGPAIAPERHDSDGMERNEFRPMHRGQPDRIDRRGRDEAGRQAGRQAGAPAHRPAAPAEDAER